METTIPHICLIKSFNKNAELNSLCAEFAHLGFGDNLTAAHLSLLVFQLGFRLFKSKNTHGKCIFFFIITIIVILLLK